ncbi:hypothetical protein PV458_19030 [Streptomyces sp. MN03-5084-2B]|nr:hypothetical protein [Streptomyces sp. MN03-5084-2B]
MVDEDLRKEPAMLVTMQLGTFMRILAGAMSATFIVTLLLLGGTAEESNRPVPAPETGQPGSVAP